MKTMKNFEGVTYYPHPGREGIYYYFPAAPVPQTDSSGDPMISIVGGGANWFLQASAKWAAPSETIEKLAKLLIGEGSIRSQMDLKVAPFTVDKAELILKTEDEERVLASSTSSGHYPFNAAFNCSLSEAQQKEVAAAFHGKEQTLVVKYHACLATEYPVTMALTGPILRASKDLNPESSLEDVARWLEDQIKKGKIELTRQFEEETPQEKIDEVYKKLINKAIAEIGMGLEPMEMTPDEATIEVKVSEAVTIQEKFMAVTDVRSWFKNDPNKHIKIIA